MTLPNIALAIYAGVLAFLIASAHSTLPTQNSTPSAPGAPIQRTP